MTPQKGTKETKDTKDSIWISRTRADSSYLAQLPVEDLPYEVMPSEEAVGRAMRDEITRAATAKRESYRQLLTTRIANDAETRAKQFDHNPGLWLRVHPNVRSLILQNVLAN